MVIRTFFFKGYTELAYASSPGTYVLFILLSEVTYFSIGKNVLVSDGEVSMASSGVITVSKRMANVERQQIV